MARGIDLNRLDPPADPDPNPFIRYRALFHAYHVARAAGWGDTRYLDLVRELDEAVLFAVPRRLGVEKENTHHSILPHVR